MAEKQKQVSDYFSVGHLETIKYVIAKAEQQTSGEIRVQIIMNCDGDLKGKVHEQAIREFEKADMHNTHDKIGVLILVVLNERTFTVIGDSGIYSKLSRGYWDNVAKAMSLYFQNGEFHVGVCTVVESVGRQLAKYFPRKTNDLNELPDDVITEKGR